MLTVFDYKVESLAPTELIWLYAHTNTFSPFQIEVKLFSDQVW